MDPQWPLEFSVSEMGIVLQRTSSRRHERHVSCQNGPELVFNSSRLDFARPVCENLFGDRPRRSRAPLEPSKSPEICVPVVRWSSCPGLAEVCSFAAPIQPWRRERLPIRRAGTKRVAKMLFVYPESAVNTARMVAHMMLKLNWLHTFVRVRMFANLAHNQTL